MASVHTPSSLPGGMENFGLFVNFGLLFFFVPLSLRPTAPSSSKAPSLPRRRAPVVATGGWTPVSAESGVEEVTASISDKSFAACATLVSSRSRRSSFSFIDTPSSASRRRISRSRAAMRERRTSSNGSSVWWSTVDRASAAVAAVRRPSRSVTASTTIDPSFILWVVVVVGVVESVRIYYLGLAVSLLSKKECAYWPEFDSSSASELPAECGNF